MENKKTLESFAQIIGITLPEALKNATYGRVLTQKEYVSPEDVVISAGWYHSETTVSESLKKGALLVVCDHKTKKNHPEDNVIGVDDPLACVQRFEKTMLKAFKGKLVTITGSVGKTTTTGFINTVLSNAYPTLTGHSMSNSHGAILRNTQRITDEYKWWVQEVGGVQPGYIESSARVLCPDIAVLTNIGESHLNTYFTKENIFHDKSSLERYAKPDGTVIINADDVILRNATYTHRVVTISLKDPTADFYAKDFKTTIEGLRFTAVCNQGEYLVSINLFGEYNAYNALAAMAVGILANIPMENILSSIAGYQPSGMRQNLVRIGGYTMMLDVFNAEPKTVLGSATTLTQIPCPVGGRRIFITGHIDKLGENSPALHEALGRDLAKLDLDQIVLFAGDSKHTYEGILAEGGKNAVLMGSREELEVWMRDNIRREDIVFYKSGQFEAALAKSVDHVYGTTFQNEQQFNEGKTVEKDGFVFRLRQDHIAEIERYVGKQTQVIIPETYEDYTVTRIRAAAFRRSYNLTSVTIPDTVVNIGNEAFYICPKLETVVLPKNLRIIGKNAFNYCKVLEKIEIPYGTIHIDSRAFYDCMGLKYAAIPETVGYFGDKVFSLDNPSETRSLRIRCLPSSYADKYAKENGLSVESVDNHYGSSVNDQMTHHSSMGKSENSAAEKPVSMFNGMGGSPKGVLMTEEEKRQYDRKSKSIFDHVKKEFGIEPEPLTKEELQEYKDAWGILYEEGIAKPQWAALYKARTGIFSPEYIGNDMHLYCVEAKVVDSTYIRGLCDKNIMPLVLPVGKHPPTLIRKLSGMYLDADFKPISEDEAVMTLMENRRKGAVIKLCRSSGGKGVTFVSMNSKEEEIRAALRESPYITVQKVIRQHPDMAKMNPSSVNTIRIMTIMLNGVPEVLSAVVRIGKAGSRVDNFHHGGMSCAINEDGTLKNFACFVNGERRTQHENGFVFAEGKVPNFQRVCNEAKKLHCCLPMFGLISWDLCIDEIGDPVLIEYNIGGGITLHQTCNGPLYGKFREQIMLSVFPGLNEKSGKNDDFDYTYRDGSVSITKGHSDTQKLIIPKNLNDGNIMEVCRGAFRGDDNLKDVRFTGPIKEIGYLAFCQCRNLERVVFEGAVDSIGRSAFNECRSLKVITLPEGTKKIGKLSFGGCPNLREIHLPTSVTEIAADAFYHSDNVAIHCQKGSYAERFAKQHGIRCVIL